MRKLGLLLLIFALTACGQQQHLPMQKTFANGDVATLHNDNQLTLKNSQGQVLQQSTFTTPTFAAAAKLLARMQRDLKLANKTRFLKEDIAYPLTVNHNGKTTLFKNPFSLREAFRKVFTKKIQRIILQQDAYRLVSNYQGVMFTNGALWFNSQGIFVVNLD